MLQTPIKNWWLLVLCGVLEAIISVFYFDHAGHGFHALKSIVLLGKLAVAAGACAVAAGIWSSARGICWLLVVNGLALGALGVIFNGVFGFRIGFRTVALLIILMAISIGILALITARTLRRQHRVVDGWFFGLAGVVSVGFALAFLAMGFRWIKLGPGSVTDVLWQGSYFGFTAICMLGLALRLHSQAFSQSDQREALPPLGKPKHA